MPHENFDLHLIPLSLCSKEKVCLTEILSVFFVCFATLMVYHMLVVRCNHNHAVGSAVPCYVRAPVDLEGIVDVPLIVPGDPAAAAGHDAAPRAALQGEHIYLE